MVADVEETSYQLSADSPNHIYTKFESGLQAWGEIIGLGAALDWLTSRKKSDWQEFTDNYQALYDFLKASPKVHLVNHEAAKCPHNPRLIPVSLWRQVF